jgi:hypothetical protein
MFVRPRAFDTNVLISMISLSYGVYTVSCRSILISARVAAKILNK